MIRSIRRRGRMAAIGSALALLVTLSPAAHATSADVIVFDGTALMWNGSAGPGYPCMSVNTPNVGKCPVIGNNGTIGGHSMPFNFASSLCTAGAVRTSPPDAGAGTCFLTAGGAFTGSCGLARWNASYTLTQTRTQIVQATVTVVKNGTLQADEVGGVLVITGTVSGGGTVVGLAYTVAVPTVTGTTTTPIDNTCLRKSGSDVRITGSLSVVT